MILTRTDPNSQASFLEFNLCFVRHRRWMLDHLFWRTKHHVPKSCKSLFHPISKSHWIEICRASLDVWLVGISERTCRTVIVHDKIWIESTSTNEWLWIDMKKSGHGHCLSFSVFSILELSLLLWFAKKVLKWIWKVMRLLHFGLFVSGSFTPFQSRIEKVWTYLRLLSFLFSLFKYKKIYYYWKD